MSKEVVGQIDQAIYSPTETQRLAQFQHIIHKANYLDQQIKNGAELRLARPQDDGTQVEIFPITGRMIISMRDIAFNMYTKYFADNPKLKSAALGITTTERELRGEAEGITESNFDKIWNSTEE